MNTVTVILMPFIFHLHQARAGSWRLALIDVYRFYLRREHQAGARIGVDGVRTMQLQRTENSGQVITFFNVALGEVIFFDQPLITIAGFAALKTSAVAAAEYGSSFCVSLLQR